MSLISAIRALSFQEMPPQLVAELAQNGLNAAEIYADIVQALAEDLPGSDVTSWPTIPAEQVETADFVVRADGSLCGLAVAEMVIRYVLGNDVAVFRHAKDGDRIHRGDVVMSVEGATALLLTAERTALNYLCHLSGVATATAAWVEALAHTSTRVRDTRKTVPHFRKLDKYAVRCGGGVNHRESLSDQALIKDNHVLAAGGVTQAYRLVREACGSIPIQVEVTRLSQLAELLEIGVESVLLDNMSDREMAEAVTMASGRCILEASGGLTIERACQVAATGVDFIAVGALTHSARVLDIAMDLRAIPA